MLVSSPGDSSLSRCREFLESESDRAFPDIQKAVRRRLEMLRLLGELDKERRRLDSERSMLCLKGRIEQARLHVDSDPKPNYRRPGAC